MYFVSRHTKQYLPLDPDAVVQEFGDLESFEIEGREHPHIIIQSAKSFHTRTVRKLSEDLDEDLQGLAAVAVLVQGIGGNFAFYAGSWDGQNWDWPKLDSAKDAQRRIESLMQLDDVDLVAIAEAAASISMLKPEVEGNSKGASNSLPKAEAST